MKSKFLGFSLLASSLLTLSIVSTACQTVSIEGDIRLDVSALTIGLGEVRQLNATIKKGLNENEVRWFSNNESVVAVDDGYVFGVGLGTATVTASFAGAYADCVITVKEGGGEASESFNVTPKSKTMKPGDTLQLKTFVYPEDEATVITFESNTPAVATVDETLGEVKAIAVGTAVITATAVNAATGFNKIDRCNITVSNESSGGGSTGSSGGTGGTSGGAAGDDIAVSSNLGYKGSLKIGSPNNQNQFMTSLLADFNRLTNSNINFTVSKFEEDNGTSGYASAASMPAVFPYASDQTLSLYQFKALSALPSDDTKWIKSKMSSDALNAAKLTSVVGYPFAADNGVVMFYNTDVIKNPSEIDTLDKLFAKQGSAYDINFSIGNGFFGAGALMTYSGGKNYYTLTPSDIDYSSTSAFNCDAGIEAAKLVRRIKARVVNATDAPTGDVLATITDVSKVGTFKKQLGSKYAVAPLPIIEGTTRLGSFLGYKFYGVNNQLNETDKKMAFSVAKFLCSEYAQKKRLAEFSVRPTLKTLAKEAETAEPHIAALKVQQDANSTIPLTAIDSSFWSETAQAVTDISALPESATNGDYAKILKSLDSKLRHNA